MKTFWKIIITLFLAISPVMVFAQETKTSEILGEDTISDLNNQETAREEETTNQLLLTVPTQTDNPSHILTFIDPSSEKKGVQLEIDGTSYQEIKSPYTLPALSIGIHTLNFKFVDQDGTTKILEKSIIVVPRPPIINVPTLTTDLVEFKGTGLANSEIVILITLPSDVITKIVNTDKDSNWTLSVDKKDLSEGIYTITGYTRKYGYASNPSEKVSFEIGDSTINTTNTGGNVIHFSFADISFTNLKDILASNTDLIILVGCTFVLGGLISLLFSTILRRKHEDRKVQEIAKKIKIDKPEEKTLTLREKLSKESNPAQPSIKPEEENVVVEEKKEEEVKIFSKMNFLKDFKNFDPDDTHGKENIQKEIPVSLTSQKE